MKQLKFTPTIGIIAVFLLSIKFANANSDSTKIYFQQSFKELKNMLEGKQPINFERAVFITENPYLNNRFDFNEFQNSVDAHVYLIEQIANENDKSSSIDFSVKIDPHAKRFDINTLNFTEKEKKEMYKKTLHNWAIYTYLNDTTYLYGVGNLPFTYQFNDPFGMNDWKNSQVTNLLFNSEKKGNCFALVSLFKILSDRLNSGAFICTAPQHIYIQHQDHKGDYYNVELATGTHPGDGSIQTLTYTFYDGIVSGISLRRLKEERQNIALCLVNLGKSYEHKFKTKDDDFLLQCAELALKYDSLNLNAMLLKEQVLEARIVQYASKKNIIDINKLRTDVNISSTFKKLETQIVHLYELGYYQMPLYMQEMILAALKREDNKPIIVQDRTPDPFPSIKNASPEDKRYSTLSGGLFEEVKVKKQFEQYGQFTLDTEKKKIVKLVDSTNFKFLIDPVVFAWSVDPLAHKYPSWSPYAAFANNPIIYVDRDGREVSKSDAFKASENREASYRTFIMTTHAQNLLNKFATTNSGDYTASTAGALSRHSFEFATENKKNLGLTTFKIEINGKFEEYNPKKHASLVDDKTKFQIQVNLFNPSNSGEGAAILNHEAFVFAEEYANAMDAFQSGKMSAEVFKEKLSEMDKTTGIENAYMKVLNPSSTYTSAQKELIQKLQDSGLQKEAKSAKTTHEQDIQQVKEDYNIK
ncbi:MAG: hypothetical protein QY303_04690 [Vicingaceae bacterium]|nr:MAG: hypothetical protein QY303_04690 [Vicingaceae bacterium]